MKVRFPSSISEYLSYVTVCGVATASTAVEAVAIAPPVVEAAAGAPARAGIPSAARAAAASNATSRLISAVVGACRYGPLQVCSRVSRTEFRAVIPHHLTPCPPLGLSDGFRENDATPASDAMSRH